MDVISIKVNLVIELFDEFTGERQLQGNVYARAGKSTYAINKDGCLVFFNKSPGIHRITVSGNCYQPIEFESEFDDSVKTKTVMLMPSRNYKFPRAATKIYGRAECGAKIRFPFDSEQVRVLGEYKAGEKVISAFFSDKTPMNSQHRYSIGNGKEDYSLKHICGAAYELDRPLDSDADYDSSVSISYDIVPSVRGEYFIAVEGHRSKAEIIIGDRIEELELNIENTEYDIKET